MAGLIPLRQFVVKVASRCDLACDHCYVYTHADQSWQGRPAYLSAETAALVADRIAEHARRHRLTDVHVVLHGGEPLLAGVDRLRRTARELRRALDGVAALDLRVHTNGVLLDAAFCRMFREEEIGVGLSLDGDRAAHDRHRVHRDGRGSFDQVVRAVALLREHAPERYAGLLCTVDVRNDPIRVYETLIGLEPPRVDFLLPHATWDNPPPGTGGEATPYADWLLAVYRRWQADGRPTRVRMFESIILTSRGGRSLTESLGLSPTDLVVIETDGGYEQADSLKTAFDGAPATGLNARDHPLDLVAAHPGITARQLGKAGLTPTCQSCSLVDSCGGGLYAHRYRTGTGFHNPSVYCTDLTELIQTIRDGLPPRPPELGFSADMLELLGTARGDPAEVAHLLRAQRGLTRKGVAQATRVSGVWPLLVRLDREHRAAVDHVFDYPYVRAWAAVQRRRGQVAVEHRGHLAAIVAAVALRAGERLRVRVPVLDGRVHLPGLGRLTVGEGTEAQVTVSDGTFEVRAGHRRFGPGDPAWEPVRVLYDGDLTVLLDDVDRYRTGFGPQIRERLDAAEFDRLREVFAAAWDLLAREHPSRAAAMRSGLRVITPVAGDGAVTRAAYGAVALGPATDPAAMALTLAREFQRAQLGALDDMFHLTEGNREAEERLYAAYGRLAHADYLGAAGRTLARQAGDLLDDPALFDLSPLGKRLVGEMRRAAARLGP
ncbi:FxsB family cyclophane-forming radical SAM/SPASM peptide maturase [Acrocarpospora catenulata]|uniref:FxsB family cyclophane-forming radical SAM/SPASM peptide maturase n=1 Tax=Acrocarpospora catenulata TaxID=2836182 RepID=UPI001BDAE509|nr:FxsB family cyclophane-forming radical SAM/SPASM peptide maturase [Acrocarpospora catenulata]